MCGVLECQKDSWTFGTKQNVFSVDFFLIKWRLKLKKKKKAKQKRRLGFPCVVPGMGNLVFAKIATVSQILVSHETPNYTQFQVIQGQEIRQCMDWVSLQTWIIIKDQEKIIWFAYARKEKGVLNLSSVQKKTFRRKHCRERKLELNISESKSSFYYLVVLWPYIFQTLIPQLYWR